MDELTHEKARLRRRGAGLWRVQFVVDGYDEEFVVFAAGDLGQNIAQALAIHDLRKQLGVRKQHVHTVSIKKET